MKISKALIVGKPYAGMIVDGTKPWEMRSRHTLIRGRVGIIEAGSGTIIGEVDIVNSLDYSKHIDILIAAKHCHRVEDEKLLAKWNKAWVLENPERYKTPVKYKHPKGAVIWVNVSLIWE